MGDAIEPLLLPRFSINERDRRWTNVRKAMQAAGVDCLVLPYNTGHWAQFQADVSYLTQLGDYESEVAAVFPLEGEVTAWLPSPSYVPFAKATQEWVSDVRSSGRKWSEVIVQRIRDLGLENGHIGVGSLDGLIHAPEGVADYRLVQSLKEQLPKARLSSATSLMHRVRYVKSDEEVEALKHATRIAELACDEAAAIAKVGVADSRVYAEVYGSMLRNGGGHPTMILWGAGPEVEGHYFYPSQRPLQLGDLISTEIEGKYSGYRAQIVQTFAINYLKPPYAGMTELSRQAFDAVLAAMKPGTKITKLIAICDEMSKETEYRGSPRATGKGYRRGLAPCTWDG